MVIHQQNLDGWISNFFHNPLSTIASTVKKAVSNPVSLITTAVGIAFPPAAPFMTAISAAQTVKQYVDIKKRNATAVLVAKGNANAKAQADAEMKIFERDFVSTEKDSLSELQRKRKNILAKLGRADTKLGAWTIADIAQSIASRATAAPTNARAQITPAAAQRLLAMRQALPAKAVPPAPAKPVISQAEAEKPLYETLLKANDVFMGVAIKAQQAKAAQAKPTQVAVHTAPQQQPSGAAVLIPAALVLLSMGA